MKIYHLDGSSNIQPKVDRRNPIKSDAAVPLLASISEIIASVVCIEIEQESFTKLGCYLYRTSLVMKELQVADNDPENATEIIQSLSKSIELAKDLVGICQKGKHTIQNAEERNIVEELKGVVTSIGCKLSSIPSSAYGDQVYAAIAAQSLSKEMKCAHFEAGKIDSTEFNRLERSMVTELDLYSIDFEDSMENLDLDDSFGSSKTINQQSHNKRSSGYLVSLPEVAQFMETPYETFFCPLAKKIMDDPVTIETGVTYERMAIIEWFSKFAKVEEIVCPKTGQKLANRNLRTNVTLRETIHEWMERNEAARINIARAALALGSTDNMVIEAIDDLRSLYRRKQHNKVQILNAGIMPLVANILDYKDRNVRYAALELLREIAEDSDDGKEKIAEEIAISVIIKMLSSTHQPIRHKSLLLILELSRTQSVVDKVSSVKGGILMLITVKFRKSIDTFESEIADEILKNLERSLDNIKCMAENGYWEPLLNHLNGGCEEIKIQMANVLGETVFGHINKDDVAKRTTLALINMINSGNSQAKSAAFKALKQISSHQSNGKFLVEAGIQKFVVEEMFIRTIYNEQFDSMKEAAAILANVVESGLELENLQANTHGHNISSDYIVCNIIYRLKNSTSDEVRISFIRILLCLMTSAKSSAIIVTVVEDTEASFSLIELINNPNEQLAVASIKLLIMLSPYMGHSLIDRLCETGGQPESLIQGPTEISLITEKHSVSASFLAKLPHHNLTLNLAMLNKNMVPIILQSISQIQKFGTRISRYTGSYLESLVGILVRFTTTLHHHQILLLAREYNFTTLFTELLMKTSSDEVQRLSALGLENLSSKSVNLAKQHQTKRTRSIKILFLFKCLSFESSKAKKTVLCPIHRGACSSAYTFCLLDAKAVDKLLASLDHENVGVVEAVLSAICTLLDDKVDVDKSVSILSEMHAVQSVLNVVKVHKEEKLWHKSFWVMEKFLAKGGDKSISDMSQDSLLPAILVHAFHHGNGNLRQMAERILKHLDKMPDTTTNFSI